MWNPAEKLSMTEEQRKTLKAWVAAKTSPQRNVPRARICLLAAEGLPNRTIAKTVRSSRLTVVQWRKRFEERGPQGLAEDAPHGRSPRAIEGPSYA
jgi:transposase